MNKNLRLVLSNYILGNIWKFFIKSILFLPAILQLIINTHQLIIIPAVIDK